MRGPVGKEVNPSIWLVGSMAVATATLTFFGVEGDGLSRLIRVHPVWLLVGAALLLLALSIGFLTLSDAPATRKRRTAQVAGLLAFVAAVCVLLGAHAHATAEQQRPTVAAELSADATPMTAKVTLTAAGLKPDEYLFVIVQGASASTYLDQQRVGPGPKRPDPIPKDEFSLQSLYKGRVGPSPTGDIDISLVVPVTQGQYDQVWVKARIITSAEAVATAEDESDLEFGQSGFPCTRETVDTACAVLLVPAGPDATKGQSADSAKR
jgi:hypothetical protein